MNEIKPRFEFRTWAPNFGLVEQKMRRLSACSGIRESSEIYIVSSGNTENNTKVRDKLMDIKVFVTEREGLEQWNPRMKGEFPMKASAWKRMCCRLSGSTCRRSSATNTRSSSTWTR